MGKVYNTPKGYEEPSYDFNNREEYEKTEEAYLQRLSEWCKNRNAADPDYVGTVIQFPFADGYALYMVVSLKPVALIHLQLGDAWEYPYVERLTKKDIVEKIDADRKFKKYLSTLKPNS